MDMETIYRLYFRDVFLFLKGLTRSEALAEELTQETFFRALDGLTFSPEIPWQAEILDVMKKIVEIQKTDADPELITSFLTQQLWYLIYLHTGKTVLTERKEPAASSQGRLQVMMQYIHQHYNQKISLEEIAEQVS